MEENLATRLKLFIDTNGLTPSQFADKCHISRSTLSQLLSGRNKKVSDGLVKLIHDAFPNLSVLWLMFGEGPVILSGGTTQIVQNTSSEIKPHTSPDNVVIRKDEYSSENSKYPYNPPVDSEYPTENALNSASNNVNNSKNQIFETDLKILELQNKIANMRKNPRRVLQITIYYDDSTFETFFPGRKGDTRE